MVINRKIQFNIERVKILSKERKKTGISISVPEKSTGRLIDAFTDMIRPFSENRGLKADRIRLQREEVAIEIAKRARQRLDIKKGIERPVRAKILVPLIEAASIEDIDDEFMIDKWANLLASATSDLSVEPRFIGILKELNGRQAKVLEAMAMNNFDNFQHGRAILTDAAYDLDVNQIRRFINNIFLKKRIAPEVDAVFDDIVAELDKPGCAINDVMIFTEDGDWSLRSDSTFMGIHDVNELDMEILVSLGLAKRVNFYYISKFMHDIEVIYFHITEVGIRFFFACQEGNWETIE